MGGILLVMVLVGSAHAVDPRVLDGSWVGQKEGREVRWDFSSPGRLRANGRAADYRVGNDTLTVLFDAVTPEAAAGQERAVYRFLASSPSNGHPRLFVYGFDLGKSGLWLERKSSEPPLPEDTAPPAPPPPDARSRRAAGGARGAARAPGKPADR